MIKIDKLTKVYKSKKRNKVKALDNINITLPNNGLVFVLGKSGSGKSTLLNLIGGLDSITEGNIIVDGNDISNFSESKFCDYRNTHIGFIFQDYHLIDELTVYDNICLSLNLRRIEDKEDVLKALKKVDLEGYENRYPTELSGGERQRVAIARAIVKNPRIILADEPTGNLDTNTATSIVELLKDLSKECLILIVSHNRNDAYKYGDRIIELAKGKVISDKSKNPSYNDNVVYEDNIIYYPHDKILDENDVNVINSNMSKENKLVIVSDKYIDTKDDNAVSNKVKIEKKSLSIIKELLLSLKFLKNKIFNIFFSSFMVSAIMIILALALTIIKFDGNKIIKNEMDKMNQNSLYITKQLNEEQENQTLPFNCVVEIEDDDFETFKNIDSNNNIYEVLSLTVPITLHHNYSQIQSSVFTNGIYVNETLGTIVVEEKFFIDKYGKLEYAAINDNIHPAGLYITDYVADSILLFNKEYMKKEYKDILGYYYYFPYNTCRGYINGVIKTGYKDKYKEFFEELDSMTDLSMSKICQIDGYTQFYNEIYSSLGFSYSLNPSFIEQTMNETASEVAYHSNMKINSLPATITDNQYVFTGSRVDNLVKLKDNEVLMSYKKYNEIFGTNYTESNLNTFIPHEINVEFYKYYDCGFENKLGSINLNIIGLYNFGATFYVNNEILSQFNQYSIFTKGLYFDNVDNIDTIIETANELNFKQEMIIVEAIHTMTKAVDVFIPIFELIAIVLCLGIIFILVSFSTKMIKDKMYDIGILKALGTQNKSVVVVFGLQIILIAIVTILLSTIGYYFFIDLANDILITSLKELAPGRVMLDLNFLTFKLDVAGFNIVLIIMLALVSLIIPMIKIKKIKPVKIIKTKE